MNYTKFLEHNEDPKIKSHLQNAEQKREFFVRNKYCISLYIMSFFYSVLWAIYISRYRWYQPVHLSTLAPHQQYLAVDFYQIFPYFGQSFFISTTIYSPHKKYFEFINKNHYEKKARLSIG